MSVVSVGAGCPVIDVNQQVTQNPDGTWTVMFFAGNPRVIGSVLQSVDRVNITVESVVTPMTRVNGLVWSTQLQKQLKVCLFMLFDRVNTDLLL